MSAPPYDDPLRADRALALRRCAEEKVAAAEAAEAADVTAQSHEQIQHLLHELRTHQIELELQNEELRRSQSELDGLRARYVDLYDQAPVAYLSLSEQGLIVEANQTAAAVLGVAKAALVGQPLTHLIAPSDQDPYYHHRRLLAATGAPQTCELRMLRPDQAPLWVQMDSTATRDEQSGAPAYRTVLSDISARVRAETLLRELNATLERRVAERTAALSASEDQLRRANADLARALRVKDEFLTMMSHELRTPLNAVLGFAELLSADTYGPQTERQRAALDTITASGHHLLALIDDIFDYAKSETGQLTLALAPTIIADVCRASMHIVTPAAHAKQIIITTTLDSAIITIEADARRLQQALINLLTNAIKFTPAGGEIGLEARGDAAGQVVTLTVWDTGIGIAEADLRRLFQPFVQLDSALSRQYEGTGLGLVLVRQLAEAHGGSVSVESTPGVGSRFSVTLPWHPAPGAGATPPAAPTLPGLLHAASAEPAPLILLVEDHESNIALLQDTLPAYGLDLAVARDGEDALARIHTLRPALVLMDIQLPGISGIEAIKRIRADEQLRAIPIIALTALAMMGDRERCLEAGANDYMAKPVRLRNLMAAIDGLIHPRS